MPTPAQCQTAALSRRLAALAERIDNKTFDEGRFNQRGAVCLALDDIERKVYDMEAKAVKYERAAKAAKKQAAEVEKQDEVGPVVSA